MVAAGRCAREVLDAAGKLASVPGTTTDDINRLVRFFVTPGTHSTRNRFLFLFF
jgi:methionine aminopeptidase